MCHFFFVGVIFTKHTPAFFSPPSLLLSFLSFLHSISLSPYELLYYAWESHLPRSLNGMQRNSNIPVAIGISQSDVSTWGFEPGTNDTRRRDGRVSLETVARLGALHLCDPIPQKQNSVTKIPYCGSANVLELGIYRCE